MEVDYAEVEVSHIPKSQFRVIRGIRGATVGKLKKEFKVEIDIPSNESKASTFWVSGPATNVAKCIAKIEALVAEETATTSADAEGKSATAAEEHAPSTNVKKHKKGSVSFDGDKNESSSNATSLSAAAPEGKDKKVEDTNAATYTFTLEKPAHAKLRGPNGSRKAELEKQLLAEYESMNPSIKAKSSEVIIPAPNDLLNTEISASLIFTASVPSSVKASIIPVIEMAVEDFLEKHDLKHQLAKTAGHTKASHTSSETAPSASAAASGGGQRRRQHAKKHTDPTPPPDVAKEEAINEPAPSHGRNHHRGGRKHGGETKAHGASFILNPFEVLKGIIDPHAPQRDIFMNGK